MIAPDWSGHLDFLYKPTKLKKGKVKNKAMFSKISYTLGQIPEHAKWDGVLEKDSKWAFPEFGSIKMAMEEVFKDHGRFKKQAKQLQDWILEEFSEEKQYKKMVDSILLAIDNKENNDG